MDHNIYRTVIQILVHDEYYSLPDFYQQRIEAFGDERPDLPSNDWVRAVWKHLYWGKNLPGLAL